MDNRIIILHKKQSKNNKPSKQKIKKHNKILKTMTILILNKNKAPKNNKKISTNNHIKILKIKKYSMMHHLNKNNKILADNNLTNLLVQSNRK